MSAVETSAGLRMGFVGVTTGSSSIMKVFPLWAEHLGLSTQVLEGIDIPMDAPSEAFRDAVSRIKDDPKHLGALVTTHKMSVFRHAGDLFDEVDPLAERFEEISSISKRDGRLIGHAKDPITARLALEEFVEPGYFERTGAHALVLGSGGAGTALSHELGVRDDAPERVICTGIDDESLAHARQLHEKAGIPGGRMEYLRVEGADQARQLVEALPEGSLVVNATGMGKDRPGSPLPDDARFPERAKVWEFNYRGSLEFLHQARAQEKARSLDVHDGWRYFIHGWTQVIAEVFDVEMTPEIVDELSAIAERTR